MNTLRQRQLDERPWGRREGGGFDRSRCLHSKGTLESLTCMSVGRIRISPPNYWQQSLPSMQELVRRATKRGDLICDPFTGSGTSGVAAISLQRRFLGCEINPATARIARDRMRRFDATKAAS